MVETSEPPRRRPWPKLPAAFTAAALSGHSAIGLALGALIYLVCLTGTAVVFVDELRLLEQPSPARAAPVAGALNRGIAQIAAEVGPKVTIYALYPSTPDQRLTFQVFGRGGKRAWISGEDGGLAPERTPFTDYLVRLHTTLTLKSPWSTLLLGGSGAALLSLVLSGVLSHPRIFRDAFRLKLSGGRRLREAELHNRLAVWGLPFHVAVSLTGAVFALAYFTITPLAARTTGGDTGKVYNLLSGPPVVIAPDATPTAPPTTRPSRRAPWESSRDRRSPMSASAAPARRARR